MLKYTSVIIHMFGNFLFSFPFSECTRKTSLNLYWYGLCKMTQEVYESRVILIESNKLLSIMLILVVFGRYVGHEFF
jgi:hypothetical protein